MSVEDVSELLSSLFVAPPAFKYAPLSSPTSIRLLQILPNTPADPASIKCSIRTVDLDDEPCYVALSYTWGQPRTVFFADKQPAESGIPYMIQCDGKLLTVTENCFKSLMHLRIYAGMDIIHQPPISLEKTMQWEPYEGSRYIWIDAICINQEDINEKSSQVSMMDRIYRQAHSVYVWLGEHDDFMPRAWRAIFSLTNCNPEIARRYSIFDQEAYKNLGVDAISRQDWVAVYAFFQRSWFSRAWIAQEIVLARRALIFCGMFIGHWDALAVTANFLNRSRWDAEMLEYGLRHTESEIDYNSYDVTCELENPFYESLDNYQEMMKIPFMAPYFRSFQPELLGNQPEYTPWEIVQHNRKPGFNPIILILELADMRLKLTEIQDSVDLREAMTALKDIKTKKESLSVLMIKSYGTVATCSTDKVYAFLSLADEESWSGLNLDYKKSAEAVFEEASRVMMRYSKSLSVLSLRQDEQCTNLKSLASWVPDFSVSTTFLPLDSQSHQIWNASSGLEWLTLPELHADGRLGVSGFQIDSVESVAESQDITGTLLLLKGIQTTRLTKLELLWRTLIADEFQHQRPAPFSCEDVYKKLVWSELRTLHLLMLLKSRGLPHNATIFLKVDEKFEKAAEVWQELSTISMQEKEFIERHQLVKEALIAIALSARSGFMYLHDGDDPLEPYKILREDLESYGQAVGEEMRSERNEMVARIAIVGNQRKLVRTNNRLLGYGPRSAQIGDEIWLLAGGKVPYILRRRENSDYQFVGEIYMHELMHGEAAHGADSEIRDIVLV